MPLDLRVVRGGDDVPASLQRLAVLGHPQSARLTSERVRDDPDLLHFIDDESERWHYHLVAFSCTFAPEPEQRIFASYVQVTLTNVDAADAPEPIAVSMEPLKQEQLRPLSLSAKITLPVVLSTEVSVTDSKERQRVALEARYEGTSRPAWHFFETDAKGVTGMHRLRFIVRVPRGVTAAGTLSAGASVGFRGTGVRRFSYRSSLRTETAGPTFTLSARL
ncbi:MULTISPECIES: hypothetical protein [unclassified Nonomuraea]|uniref:hypothetical protein n=1 Tax=unclassified Nonomuraea TaxID=2593643 RepID=UPI0033D573E9